MRAIVWALLLLCSFAVTAGREPEGRVIEVSTAEELMAAFREPLENVTVKLAPGTYELVPAQGFDAATFHCDENAALVPVTIGLTVSGKDVRLVGPSDGEAVIVTNASHGVFFKDCEECVIERVTVTGTGPGIVSQAAYGPIVARNSTVTITHCVISETVGDPKQWGAGAHYGPAGIVARSGAELTVEYNEIATNYIGIMLLAGAHAVIRNNLMEPADSSFRAGVEISCDAVATIERNHIRGASNGIGAVERANVLCRGNIIEEGGRIVFAGDERLHLIVEKNVVYRCRGVMISGVDSDHGPVGRVSSNIVVESTLGIMTRNLDDEFVVRGNTLYDTRAESESLANQGTREMFWRARRQWTRTYRNTAVGVDGRHKFHESAFLTRYGRWAD